MSGFFSAVEQCEATNQQGRPKCNSSEYAGGSKRSNRLLTSKFMCVTDWRPSARLLYHRNDVTLGQGQA
jgi:hypothetical protein